MAHDIDQACTRSTRTPLPRLRLYLPAFTMPLPHRVADDEKFAIVVPPDASGTTIDPSPRFLIAMIRGPFTSGEMDSYLDKLGAYAQASSGCNAVSGSGDEIVHILASRSYFGPRVIVETRGITLGSEMEEAEEIFVHATIGPFFARRLIDGYSFYVGAHYINQMLSDAIRWDQQGQRRYINSERLHQPGGGVADNL